MIEQPKMRMNNNVICLDSSESENDDENEKKPAESTLILNTSFESEPRLLVNVGRVKIENDYEDGDVEAATNLSTKKRPGPRKRIYKCTLCKKELVGMSLYKYHMKSIHRGANVVGAQKRNFAVGAKKRNRVCSLCNIQVTGVGQLTNHMRHVHGTKYHSNTPGCMFFKCPACNLTLDRADLDDHLKKVHQTSLKKMSPFTCPKCDRKFCRYGNLLYHEKMFHGQPDTLPDLNHLSEEVNEEANEEANEEVNEDVNPNEETPTCSKCQKKFSSRNWLLRHEFMCGVTKKITFPCSYCPAVFSIFANVKRHEQSCHSRPKTLPKTNKQTKTRKRRSRLTLKRRRRHISNVNESSNGVNQNEIQKKNTRIPRKYKTREISYVNESSNDVNPNEIPEKTSIPRKCKTRDISYVNESSSEVELNNYIQSEDRPSGWVSNLTPGGVKLIYADKLCCSYCPKFFACIPSKLIHEKLHTGENAYQCKHCQATFRLPQKHAAHEKKCLKLIGTVWCPFCDFQNKLRYKVESHCMSFHEFDMSKNEFLLNPSNDVQTFDDRLTTKNISQNDTQNSDEMNFIKVEEQPGVDDVTVISDNEEGDSIWSDFIIIDDD